MLTYEEAEVLCYLRGRRAATLDDVAAACLRTSAEWAERVVTELEWMGLVTVFPGRPPALQLTERGADRLRHLAGSPACA